MRQNKPQTSKESHRKYFLRSSCKELDKPLEKISKKLAEQQGHSTSLLVTKVVSQPSITRIKAKNDHIRNKSIRIESPEYSKMNIVSKRNVSESNKSNIKGKENNTTSTKFASLWILKLKGKNMRESRQHMNQRSISLSHSRNTIAENNSLSIQQNAKNEDIKITESEMKESLTIYNKPLFPFDEEEKLAKMSKNKQSKSLLTNENKDRSISNDSQQYVISKSDIVEENKLGSEFSINNKLDSPKESIPLNSAKYVSFNENNKRFCRNHCKTAELSNRESSLRLFNN